MIWVLGAGFFREAVELEPDGTECCPRELRHTFVSLMSDHGVSIETISKLVGHKNTKTNEDIYRHQLSRRSATAPGHINVIFKTGTAKSA